MYNYHAIITKVHDGDTVTADVDLGFGVWLKGQKIRLSGINAPELRLTEGALSRDFLADLVNGKTVIIDTVKDRKEKYGRWLGVLWVGKVNVNELLLANDLAIAMEM